MTDIPAVSPARQLARVVSLAARVEPELLRSARLKLLPGLDVSAEADLWFSSLVQSRTPLAIVLRVDALEGLRTELAEDPDLLDRAWEVVAAIHVDAPPVLRLEERLTWLGMHGARSAQEVDELLRRAVFSMVGEERGGIARWSARAFERLPSAVKAHESARMLNVGAKARLGSRIDPAEVEDAGEWLSWVVPELPPVDIGIRLLEGAVEVGSPSTEGAHLLKVPQTNPPFVEVSWQRGEASHMRQVPVPQPVRPVIVETGTTTARIRTALGPTYQLARRQRLATERVFGLRGRIVAMDDAGTIIADGVIYVENETIYAVQPADAPAPAGFEDVEVVETDGTIYPGLIELHNHLLYDVLPLWKVRRRYGNRQQWASDASYRSEVAGPSAVIRQTPGLPDAVIRFVEARCLAAGVTTTQGIAQGVTTRPASMVAVRVADQSSDPELPSAETRIRVARTSEILRSRRPTSCLLMHLAEGTDARARSEFEALRASDGEWAIDERLAIVHGTALEERELKILGERNAAIVWSPLHDFRLYGQTLDVRAAREFGIRIGLGSSWSVTGSRNLLGELKWARAASRVGGAELTDADLVAGVTRIAADILGWGRLLGSIVVGKRADVIVIRGAEHDPYQAVVEASEADIVLVIVNGVARTGLAELMRRFARRAEPREIAGTQRLFDFRRLPAGPESGPGLKETEERLRGALGDLPDLASRIGRMTQDDLDDDVVLQPNVLDNDPGASTSTTDRDHDPRRPDVHPMELEPLTIVDDPDYLPRLLGQPNIPSDVAAELYVGGSRAFA